MLPASLVRSTATARAAGRLRAGRPQVACRAAADGDYKRAAAKAAVDKWVAPGAVIGIGTGEIVNHAIDYLAQQVARGALPGVVAVPSCGMAANEAAFSGLQLSNLEEHPRVDVYFEEADQIDVRGNAFLKGLRSEPVQPDLPSSSRLLAAASRLVVLADSGAAVSGRLTAALPVAIEAEGWEDAAEEVDDMFLGDAELWRRPSSGTADPRGGPDPYVSEDGSHTLVDIRFYEGMKLYGEDEEYDKIAAEISSVPGVLAHGLVVGRACCVIVADPEEGVTSQLMPDARGPGASAAV